MDDERKKSRLKEVENDLGSPISSLKLRSEEKFIEEYV